MTSEETLPWKNVFVCWGKASSYHLVFVPRAKGKKGNPGKYTPSFKGGWEMLLDGTPYT